MDPWVQSFLSFTIPSLQTCGVINFGDKQAKLLFSTIIDNHFLYNEQIMEK